MEYIIGLVAAVFLVLTLVIIGRITTLAKGLKGTKKSDDGDWEVNDQPGTSNKVNALMLPVSFVVFCIAATWSYLESEKDFLPDPSSVHGVETDSMFWFSMAIITLAFVGTSALLFGFSFRYQYNPNRRATFYPVNHKLEIIWTIIPAIVMAALVFTGWRVWSDITAEAPEEAYVIEVVGKQFNWVARYPGKDDSRLGNYNYKLIDSDNELGIDPGDETALDDFTSTTLYIPKDKPVLLRIRSKDVLHSVFLPHLRVKMDAVPGMPTKFWFTATKTTDELKGETNNPDFEYQLNCTEVCGQGHFSMKMPVKVVEEEEYVAWMNEQPSWLKGKDKYLSKVPENMRAKALQYIGTSAAPTEAESQQPVLDGTVGSGRANGTNGAGASLR
jgi:cytochrome c oxidase subunit 2